MKDKCLNYRFWISIVSGFLLLFIAIIIFVYFEITEWTFAIILLIIAITGIVFTLRDEALFYVITQEKIMIVYCFRQYVFYDYQIKHIKWCYDVIGEFLSIKDYVLVFYKENDIPSKCTHVLKCRRTKKLMEEYYGSKIRDTLYI